MNGARSLRKRAPSFHVAGHRTRLDHRRALPVLAERFVIVDRRSAVASATAVEAGIRPQAQIDPQHVAVGSSAPAEGAPALGSGARTAARARRPAESRRIGIEEHDQIDVARIVEFARAMLAERQHDQARNRARDRRVRSSEGARRRRSRAAGNARRRNRRVGEMRQSFCHRDDAPHAPDVGERDQQRRLALGVSKACMSSASLVRRAAIAPMSRSSDSLGLRLSSRTSLAGSSWISPQR